MLGSASDAEDIVQEAQLRLHRALEDGHEIQSPRAFVATVTTRLAINKFRSARARREQYVGEWLPEPIITDSSNDPAQHAQMVVVGGRGECGDLQVWRGPESNWGHHDFQSCALPTELPRREVGG
jgi:DNA-directed RNA polymerase specialized sigma24 family protein